jgi:hypothetical protein
MTPIAKVQAVLHLTMGEPDHALPQSRPANAWLRPGAIAAMIGWVLTAGPEMRP